MAAMGNTGNRPETTAESLAKLKPAFRKDGTITATAGAGRHLGAEFQPLEGRKIADSTGSELVGQQICGILQVFA